jgi:hypothetical protein
VQFNEEAEVKCPYRDDDYACNSVLQEREIKAVSAVGITVMRYGLLIIFLVYVKYNFSVPSFSTLYFLLVPCINIKHLKML